MNASSCADTLSEIKTVEHVQVVLSLKHRNRGHLSIELISPAGTRTQLLKTRRNDKSNKGLKVRLTRVTCFSLEDFLKKIYRWYKVLRFLLMSY